MYRFGSVRGRIYRDDSTRVLEKANERCSNPRDEGIGIGLLQQPGTRRDNASVLKGTRVLFVL